MEEIFLTTQELANRWKVSPETLRSWRFSAKGPLFEQFNGVIRYKVEDVLKFEQARLRRHTADNTLVGGVEGKVNGSSLRN